MRILFLLLAFFYVGLVHGQIDKSVKLPSSKKIPLQKENLIELNQDKIPFFDNVKTIKRDEIFDLTNKEIISVSEFSKINGPKNYFNIENIKPLNSSVNGVLTPRDNYMNDNVYLEFLDSDVNPLTNQAKCKCSRTDIGFVNTIFWVEAGKRYLLTYDLSPNERNNEQVAWIFANGVSQTKTITRDHELMDLVIRPETTGIMKLWMQCANPNSNDYPFYFNSVTIQTVD